MTRWHAAAQCSASIPQKTNPGSLERREISERLAAQGAEPIVTAALFVCSGMAFVFWGTLSPAVSVAKRASGIAACQVYGDGAGASEPLQR